MYVIMKRYPVAVLRERLSEALDAAYQGVPVLIERKGVQYRLTRAGTATKKKRTTKRAPLVEILDPAVLAGEWTWDWTPDGMTFAARTPAARRTTKKK